MKTISSYGECREHLAMMLDAIGRMLTLPQGGTERRLALQEFMHMNPAKELRALAKANGDLDVGGPLVSGLQELLPAIIAAGAGVPLNFDADALLRDAAARIGRMMNVLLSLCESGDTKAACRPCVLKAFAQYRRACERASRNLEPEDGYSVAQTECEDGETLPRRDTWCRYVRSAIQRAK
jgi:hypothetical protein